MIFPSRKYKFVLKFNIESNIKTLNTKISTILSQKRINSSDFLLLLKEKLILLNIREDVNILLRVVLFVFELDDYIIYIKMPSLSSLLNRFFFSKKNFDCPGFSFKKNSKNYFFNYALTPYMIYEIMLYKSYFDNNDSLVSVESYFKKKIGSLKSKGVNLII
jgi:hypothetical protein